MGRQSLKAKGPYTEISDRVYAKGLNGKTALYRHFDKDDQLLYVGISLNHVARLAQHRDGSHWYEEIAQVTIEWHGTRVEAELAESRAIGSESPKHNKQNKSKALEQIAKVLEENTCNNSSIGHNIDSNIHPGHEPQTGAYDH